jgi:hypothetical protein
MASERPTSPSVEEYLSKSPGDLEWARGVTERYAALSPAARLAALASVNGWLDALLGGRAPVQLDGEHPFWRHWVDPALGRPRRAP